ncbi:hypothetical protein ABT024_32345 [Streptomyces sp. NPDC002812]|uniref:hypothetical protein n=1 Tax=Streptomyces sp. NPDC002812 TaxID=3154434 RepID=UPI003319B628
MSTTPSAAAYLARRAGRVLALSACRAGRRCRGCVRGHPLACGFSSALLAALVGEVGDNRIKGLLLAAVTFIEGDGDTFGEDVQQLSRALDGSGMRDDQDMYFEALAMAVENAEITSF